MKGVVAAILLAVKLLNELVAELKGDLQIQTVIGKLEEAHSVDEKINIEELLKFIKTLIVFIIEWCNIKKMESK